MTDFFQNGADWLLVSLKPKLYRSVIEDVINDVREVFLDEGVDEQVLLELRTVS